MAEVEAEEEDAGLAALGAAAEEDVDAVAASYESPNSTMPILSWPQLPHLTPGVAFCRTSSILRGEAVHLEAEGSISPARIRVEVASLSPGLT